MNFITSYEDISNELARHLIYWYTERESKFVDIEIEKKENGDIIVHLKRKTIAKI